MSVDGCLPAPPPPRKPGRWTWAVAGRLCSRTFVAFTLLWVVALVGWPEEHERTALLYHGDRRKVTEEQDLAWWAREGHPALVVRMNLYRDADLRVLWELLFPPEPDVVFLRLILRGPLAGGTPPLSFSAPVAADD